MEDFKNHKFYFVMWLPAEKNSIWGAKTKTQLVQNELVEGIDLYVLLNQQIDLETWRKAYGVLYQNWLENDDLAIFDLQNPIIQNLLNALQIINKNLPENLHLCFWYDIDRTENEAFIWQKSPISEQHLIDLGTDFFHQNRLWDKDNFLLMPHITSVLNEVSVSTITGKFVSDTGQI